VSNATNARHRAWVEVDLAALRRNLRRVRQAAGAAAGIVPMLKADAYGLGMEAVLGAVAGELAPEGPWAVGVAAVAEGEALRGLGWRGRVVVFAPLGLEEYTRAARAGLTLALSSPDAVGRWASAARTATRSLAFHAEVDTGMGRAGLAWDRAGDWAPAVRDAAADLLEWEGCFTHFHSADAPDLSATDEQHRRFRAALEALGWTVRVTHSSNSAATLRRGGYGDALVRPGIYLYGGEAGPGVVPEPVAAVRARIGLLREVQPGTTVGYGATYAARRRERWGTLPIGYGDGVPRALYTGGGEALVRGRRVPVVGRISMDATVLDLTDVPGAAEGDVATLVGTDGNETITLDEVARRCGTISYEILTGLTPRLPRVYAGR
jgi:alanine racemase